MVKFINLWQGKLKDGTLAAVKVLSAKSSQGVREFLSEIVAISGIEHENLVKLIGCCVEGDHRILVYGYLENLSIAQTLLGIERFNSLFIIFWPEGKGGGVMGCQVSAT